MENIKINYLCIKSPVLDIGNFTEEELKELIGNVNAEDDYLKTQPKDNRLIKIRLSQPKSHGNIGSKKCRFYISIPFYRIYSKLYKDFDLVEAIIKKVDSLKKEFPCLNKLNKNFFNLKNWEITKLFLCKTIDLEYDYANYIEIIEQLNVKNSQLTMNYDNWNEIYFYPNNNSRNPKDILKKDKYIKISNYEKMKKLKEWEKINKKRRKKILDEELPIISNDGQKLYIELGFVSRINNESMLFKQFKRTEKKILDLISLWNDYKNGSPLLFKFFSEYLKKKCFYSIPEIMPDFVNSETRLVNKEKLFKYLSKNKNIPQSDIVLQFIIAALLVDTGYSKSALSKIGSYLDEEMSPNAKIHERIKTINNVQDNIRKGTLTFTIAELYKELYDKLFEIGEAQSHREDVDIDFYDDLENDFDFEEDEESDEAN